MKILNLGSVNIDNVYRVDEFLAPGETKLSAGLSLFCGGKGLNQSIAAARAGNEVCHAGLIGEDGGMLLDKLRKRRGHPSDHGSPRTLRPCDHSGQRQRTELHSALRRHQPPVDNRDHRRYFR